jgi:hypothetical protein
MVAPAYARDTLAISIPKVGQRVATIPESRTKVSPYEYVAPRIGFEPTQLPVRQPFIEPVPYRQPTFTIPGVPIIPPFGFPFNMPGGSATPSSPGRTGKYPFREVIPLNWQLW